MRIEERKMAETAVSDKPLLYLGADAIRFSPLQVFYDSRNGKIFVLPLVGAGSTLSGKSFSISVLGPTEADAMNFHLPVMDTNQILSMKLSPNFQLLAMQRIAGSVGSVDFCDLQLANENVSVFTQNCKAKNARLIGVEWVGDREVVFVTTSGLELYQVNSGKRNVRVIKVHNCNLNWFVYSHDADLLVASTGTLGNVFHCFIVKPTYVTRLPKFEVDLAANPQPPRLVLLDRDVTIAKLYSRTSVLVLRHNPRPTNAGAELLIYQIATETVPAQKTHVLKLGAAGRFAVHVEDNLVLVHQQVARVSMIFDIAYPTQSFEKPNIHYPLFPLQSLQLAPCLSSLMNSVELYSRNWVIFQPNVIVDAVLGYLWHVEIDLSAAISVFPDKFQLIDFLLRRRLAKTLLLNTLRSFFSEQMLSLSEAGNIFNRLNDICAKHANGNMPISNNHTERSLDTIANSLVIDQHDLYTSVFFPLTELDSIDHVYLANVVIEYLNSLCQHKMQPQLFLHDAVVQSLVRSNQWERLLQLFQYHVLADAKPLAFLLLSLEVQFPAAAQVAVDMLGRLHVATDEIVEILLSKDKVCDALKLVQAHGLVDSIDPLKFLEAASSAHDDHVFYAVFRFFEQRHLRLKGGAHFSKGDTYEKYLLHFRTLCKAPVAVLSVTGDKEINGWDGSVSE